jgi:hypothetical protein
MRQEANGFPAFGQKAGEIRRNQPVSGSAAPIFWGMSSILTVQHDVDLTSIAIECILTETQDKEVH